MTNDKSALSELVHEKVGEEDCNYPAYCYELKSPLS
jgi:hypothetical protein